MDWKMFNTACTEKPENVWVSESIVSTTKIEPSFSFRFSYSSNNIVFLCYLNIGKMCIHSSKCISKYTRLGFKSLDKPICIG